MTNPSPTTELKLENIIPKTSPNILNLTAPNRYPEMKKPTVLGEWTYSMQSQLFLSAYIWWFLMFRSNKNFNTLDFMLVKPDPIQVKYLNGDEYYVALDNVKFYGFKKAKLEYRADRNNEKSLVEEMNNNYKPSYRTDKIWKFEIKLTADHIWGDGEFNILDRTQLPLTRTKKNGILDFSINNLLISATVIFKEIDNSFAWDKLKFRAPYIKIRALHYDAAKINVKVFPAEYSCATHVTTPNVLTQPTESVVCQIFKDFMREKFACSKGKLEIKNRLNHYLFEKLTPVIMSMKSKLETSDAFFYALNMEPLPDRTKAKYQNNVRTLYDMRGLHFST